MLTLEEAQTKLLALADPLGHECLSPDDANGRYLAEALITARTQPAGDLSAMDGYAIGTGDDAGPWSIIGESAAGKPFKGTVTKGEAVRISTGAVIPDGANAVLLQENAERNDKSLSLTNDDAPSTRHIRKAGFDFVEGDIVLSQGTQLGAAQLALARMAGASKLCVYRRPTLTVIDCGDELVSKPEQAKGALIPATNGAMIGDLATGLVSNCVRMGPIADSQPALVEAFDTSNSDIVVISGGASVGDHDLVKPALLAWGAELSFWRVSIRPGKPLLVATKGEQIIIGLPGNPVSAFVTAFVFLLPLLRKLGGSRNPLPYSLRMPLTGPLAAGGPRTEFVRAKLSEDGAEPRTQRDSSALQVLAATDLLIERVIGAPAAAVGDMVRVYPIHNGGIA